MDWLTPLQMERLGWNLFALLGVRLGTVGVRWLVQSDLFPPQIIAIGVLLVLGILAYGYSSVAPQPLDTMRSSHARLFVGSGLAGLIFGFF
ncbi:MAG: hypothetical protein F6K30_06390 [Cyanothece sp. SIO2G6]|nr:hypothetical protein [Cyanothece sp. SIO2G6]